MKTVTTTILILCLVLSILSLPLVIAVEDSPELWRKTFGGDSKDICKSMIQTTDGEFVLLGFLDILGNSSVWLVKTDPYGNMEWNKTVSGSANSFIQTLDDGFAFVGTHASPIDGYIPVGYLPEDFWSHVWMSKTDAYGNMEWNKTFDEIMGCYHGSSLIQTEDGGYALTANSFSSIGDYDDVLLIKTDSHGYKEWSKLFDYSEYESDSGLIQTIDGGFVLVGRTYSLGEGPTFWLVKTDKLGTIEWNITYVNTRMVTVSSILQLSDESFVLAGATDTFGDRGADFYLTKIEDTGNMEWIQFYGTKNNELNYPSLIQTSDGGFALFGYTVTSDDGLLADFLLIKIDKQGNMVWNQTYAGEAILGHPSLVQTSDGGFALSASIGNWKTGDYDFLLIKTDEMRVPEFPSWTIFPILIVSTLAVIVIRIKFRKRGLE